MYLLIAVDYTLFMAFCQILAFIDSVKW